MRLTNTIYCETNTGSVIVNSQTAVGNLLAPENVCEQEVLKPVITSDGYGNHSAVVKRVTKQGRDCVAITLGLKDSPEGEFSYRHGQYVVLHVTIDGKEYQRPYSLCSCSVTDQDLMIAVKRISGGIVSNYLNDSVSIGDTVLVSQAEGKFFVEPNAMKQRQFTLIAAGSGISPLYSMIQGLLRIEPKSRIQLLYSNKNSESIIFQDELKLLCKNHPGQLRIDNYFTQMPALNLGKKLLSRMNNPRGWRIHQGRIKPEQIKKHIRKDVDVFGGAAHEYYICGPQDMIDEVVDTLTCAGVPIENIHHEYFYAQAQSNNSGASDFSTTQKLLAEVKDQNVTLVYKGQRSTFQVHADETILDAAERAGLAPPYSCRSAVCSSCTGRITSGRVVMSMNNVLSDDEIAERKVITCQAHPLTDDVVIEYDPD